MTEQLIYRDARTGSVLVATTLAAEMTRDPSIVVFGEDVADLGGVFGATRRLAQTFGPTRVFDTPISETAFVGMAIGAAQSGLRPVIEIMFADFVGVCFDQIANQLAKNHYMSGGEVRLPVVIRTAGGCIGSAAQHSQLLSATLAHIPGLKVAVPGSSGDLQGLLVTAVRSDDPVVFIEHKNLLKAKNTALALNDVVPLGDTVVPIPFGQSRLVAEGTDVTIVTYGWMVQESLQAAETLQRADVHAAVLDLRTLVPLDRDGLVAAAARTPRLLVVDEDYLSYGVSGEVLATVAEELGHAAPLMRRLAPSVSMPASKVLEDEVLVGSAQIAEAVTAFVAGDS